MDRTRRISVPHWAMLATIVMLAATAWIGYRTNSDSSDPRLASSDATDMHRTRATASDSAVPRLLPHAETAVGAIRLTPLDNATARRRATARPLLPSALPGEAQPTAGFEGSADGPAFGPALTPATIAPRGAEPERTDAGEAALGVASPSLTPTLTPEQATVPPNASPFDSFAENGTFEPQDAGESRTTLQATPYEPGARSPQLEQIARQADSHTRRGFELASLKAHHSARAEFVRALRVVAQGLDGEYSTQVHSRALSVGLAALDEADDFVPVGSGLEGDLDLKAIIIGHATPELKLADHRTLTPLRAFQAYMEYARGQLAIASGNEVAGSMALHALGKLHRTLAEQQSTSRPTVATKSLVYLQASVQVCPDNYLAFNDLGVLLAHGSRHVEAAAAFERSLAIRHTPTASINLAMVSRHLGDSQRAEWIERRAAALAAAERRAASQSTRPAPPVVWVAPQEFAGSYANTAGPWEPAPVQRDPSAAAPTAPVEQASRGWSWNPFQKQQ